MRDCFEIKKTICGISIFINYGIKCFTIQDMNVLLNKFETLYMIQYYKKMDNIPDD